MPDAGPRRTESARFNRIAAIGIGLALAALFVWEVRASVPVTVDDAFITFSYSKNLARGHGLVYGHGVVVEGYSNFLWVVTVALGLLVRPDANPTIVARILTLPFVLLLALATYDLCRQKSGRAWSVAAVALLLVNADMITAFQIGLETLAYTALLVFAFALYARFVTDKRLARWVVPAFVAVALMRIDGFVPLAFVLVLEAARRVRRREWSLREYARWALPGVLVYAAWFAWRWHMYGLPLPTTYYAKALIPKILPDRGWQYLKSECLANGTYLVLPFAVILLLRRDFRAVAVVLFTLGHAVYVARVGGDWMPYGRFLLPIFPLVLVIVIWGGADLTEMVAVRFKKASRLAQVLPLAALLFIGARIEPHLWSSDLQRGKRVFSREQMEHVNNLTATAKLLDLAMPPGAHLVTDYGGVFAYYTDAAPIEMWGLCNAAIATRGGVEGVVPIYGRTCPECYPELNPEFFHVMTPITRDLGAFHSHQEVVNNVWQTNTIGRYFNFATDFVSGRVMVPRENRAVYFLERRRPGKVFAARTINQDVKVDYPFEPGGRAAGL